MLSEIFIKNFRRLQCLPLVLVFLAYARSAEPISKFEKPFSLRFSTLFNYYALSVPSYSEKNSFESNLPVKIGLGAGYKDFFWDLYYSIPKTANLTDYVSSEFEFKSNYFRDASWGKFYVTSCSGFSVNEDGEREDVDLYISNVTLEFIYAFNYQRHSLRAVYNLDRKQNESSGSFLMGFGLYDTGFRYKSSNFFKQKRFIFYGGPKFGYSYTWVYKNGIFLNLNGDFSPDLGYRTHEEKFTFVFQVTPKLSIGHAGEIWCWNINMQFENKTFVYNLKHRDLLNLGSFGAFIIRRF